MSLYRVIGDTRVGFTVGADDPSLPLVIDPTLIYSTFLAGNGDSSIQGISLDSSKNIYVAGYTAATNFPVANVYQSTPGGANDIFVTKLSPDGSIVLYSTYIGGSLDDKAYGFALDPSGNMYVTGQTKSGDFPTHNPLQGNLSGTNDAFALKLDPSGSGLLYSTYLGGTGTTDWGWSISGDPAGNAYVTGYTNSNNFPVFNATQPDIGGSGDTFITKINPDGSSFVYSTYLGGTGSDASTSYGMGITSDSNGNVYVGCLLHPLQISRS